MGDWNVLHVTKEKRLAHAGLENELKTCRQEEKTPDSFMRRKKTLSHPHKNTTVGRNNRRGIHSSHARVFLAPARPCQKKRLPPPRRPFLPVFE